MLSIGKLAAGQDSYDERQVAQGGDDYYSGRGEGTRSQLELAIAETVGG